MGFQKSRLERIQVQDMRLGRSTVETYAGRRRGRRLGSGRFGRRLALPSREGSQDGAYQQDQNEQS
jgi:hypothetical protein